MQMFLIINNVEIKINADVNVKNQLTKRICGKEFIWNPINCECECDKSYNIGEYLDYQNC